MTARRDKFFVPVANFFLRRCSRDYQRTVKGSIVYGLEAAARDSRPIAQVVRDELRQRGWRILIPIGESHGAPPFLSPDGARFPNLGLAVQHQIECELRELAKAARESDE